MITDGRVLEDEFVPRRLRHRDGAMNQLANALNPITRGQSPSHALIFGPTGTGKTCLAKYATDELQQAAAVNIQHVDCWQDHTRLNVLHRVVSGFDHTTPDRSAAKIGPLLTRLESYNGPPVVVILDEAELLDDPNIIRDYHRTNFCVVIIATDQTEFYNEVPAPIENRLSGNPTTTLGPYSINEVASILEDRAEVGLKPGAIDRKQLERIADHAVGNARTAITLLRNAANAAEREGFETITDEVIDSAREAAHSEIRRNKIGQLLEHQQVVFRIVNERDRALTTTEVYDIYSDRVDEDHRSNRTIRKYLSKLADYSLIAREGADRNRKYRSMSV